MVTNISGRYIGPTFKGKTVQDFDFSTLEDGTEAVPKTSNVPQRSKGVYDTYI
jgi:hypothetical protein